MLLKLSNDPERTKTGTMATLDELKHQLNIPVEFADDDAILTALLETAIEQVESDTNSDIMDTANVLEHRFSMDEREIQVPTNIYINQSPARSVDKIEIYTGEAWQEVPATDYTAALMFSRIELYFKTTLTAAKIRFTFTTGYTDAKRPKRLKQAALLKAADLFDVERSNFVVGTIPTDNKTYMGLISKHVRRYW